MQYPKTLVSRTARGSPLDQAVRLGRLVSDLDGTVPPPKGERWRQIHPVYVAELGPEASTIGPPAELP